MITATFHEHAITVSGHSGYGAAGQDIVCAAASILRGKNIGNGPFTLKDGSIIVGKEYIPGLVIKSAQTFERLYNRIDKNMKRHKGVVLTIV